VIDDQLHRAQRLIWTACREGLHGVRAWRQVHHARHAGEVLHTTRAGVKGISLLALLQVGAGKRFDVACDA